MAASSVCLCQAPSCLTLFGQKHGDPKDFIFLSAVDLGAITQSMQKTTRDFKYCKQNNNNNIIIKIVPVWGMITGSFPWVTTLTTNPTAHCGTSGRYKRIKGVFHQSQCNFATVHPGDASGTVADLNKLLLQYILILYCCCTAFLR